MANSRSAEKRIRVAERNRLRNKFYKTRYKNIFKRIEKLLAEGNKDEALSLVSLAQKQIDKAADVRAIHPNKAARTKSRLALKLAKH